MWPIRKRERTGTDSLWFFCDGGVNATVETTSTAATTSAGPPPATDLYQAGCAALAYQESGELMQWAWRPLPAMTNNEAEYAGLLLGFELASQLRATSAIFLLDSANVVGQMNGHYAVNSHALVRWNQQAWQAQRRIAHVRICYIPREWNWAADALARQARLPWPTLRQWVDREMRKQEMSRNMKADEK